MEYVKCLCASQMPFDPQYVVVDTKEIKGMFLVKSEYIKFYMPDEAKYAHEGFHIVRKDQLIEKNKI